MVARVLRRIRVRPLFLWLHRWTGLAIAVFLALAGLSGSVLVYLHQLDAALNPDLFHVAWQGEVLPPDELIARIERTDPRITVSKVPLRVAPGESAMLSVRAKFDRPPAGGLMSNTIRCSPIRRRGE